MRSFLCFIVLLSSSFLYAQEISKVEKLKIGNYVYSNYLYPFFNYERNIDGMSFYIRLNDKKQFLGTAITYRRTNSSKNYEKKVGKELPPDVRSTYKDGIILSEGKIDIDEKNKMITIVENTFVKDNGFENEPDSVKRVYRQRKGGLFNLVLLTEYRNGQEKIIVKK